MIDERVMQIADDALAGVTPTRDDVLYLLDFDCYSVEAAYVNARARQIGAQACNGIGLIEGQIGVDANPCPENCKYCSFAAVNSGIVDNGVARENAFEVPVDEIVRYARMLDEKGVHLISLMATAGLPFERYLEMVSAVRAAIADDQIILANTRDLSLEEARALKAAGANAAYHACRCGEGYVTGIPVEQRHATMRTIREAGLALMSGVEPLWVEMPHDELADRICEIPDFGPFATGACGLSNVPGSALPDFTPAPLLYVKYVAAIIRLVCGLAVPFGGVGAAIWVDAGCDP
ncbi:MAG: hypothetical protein IJH04_08675, partial [Eggerthellaceae bacterium]|nr:hypothetical protein [Eggerthellaceae bacterium]